MQISRTSMERIQQIRSHLSPIHTTVNLSNQTSSPTQATTLQDKTHQTQDYIFPDEDESKFVYTDIPQEDKFQIEFSFEDELTQPKEFTLPSGKIVMVGFRRCIEGEDDEAVQALDAKCRQGAESGLETKFYLRERWADIQGRSECVVAYPIGQPKRIIAMSRGFRKWVFLNGQRVPLTYHFFLRSDPEFRGCGLGEFTERVLLYHDYEQGVRYIMGYMVPDNKKSSNLMSRLSDVNQSALTELKRWFVSGYTPESLIKKIDSFSQSSSTYKILYTNDIKIQVDHTKEITHGVQLVSCDLSNIFRCKLSEGSYFAMDSTSDIKLASFSVWNSGAIRTSRLPGMKNFLENPCLFYNVWTNPSVPAEKGIHALLHLMKHVASQLGQTKAHGYIYVFLVEDHPLALEMKEAAEFFVAWKARLYYWDAAFQHDPVKGLVTFYDPRDSLQ